MSYIDELRERFQAAEQRFGQINEASRKYRERLMGLMSRIEEEIRCRRDVEQQQAAEIERLSGENEQLRTMMISLLGAVESGDTDSLGNTLNDMDSKVSTLIGEGQGAAAPVISAAADRVEDADEPVEDEAIAPPSFPAGDMMSTPDDEPIFSAEDADLDHGEESGAEQMVADETVVAEVAEQDDLPVVEDDAPILTETESAPEAHATVDDEVGLDVEFSGAGEPAQASLDRNVASEIADFFGAEDQGSNEIVPAYADAVAGWEDFLVDGEPSPEASMSEPTDAEPAPEGHADLTMDAAQDEVPEAAGANESLFDEVVEDKEPSAGEATDAPDVAEDSGDPDAGSIHDLLGRVKTEIEGDDQNLDADESGKTAAQ